jgi:hypothetical protein
MAKTTQELQKALKQKIAAMKSAVGSMTGDITLSRSAVGLLLDVQNLTKRLLLTNEDDNIKPVLQKAADYFGGFDLLGKGNIGDLCVAIESLVDKLNNKQIKATTQKILKELSDFSGNLQLVSKPGWDESDNQWRYRVREPSEFKEGSFRTVSITEGVSSVMGKLSESEDDTMTIQALRFSKDVFEEVQSAKDWLGEHSEMTKAAGDVTSKGWTLDRLANVTKAGKPQKVALDKAMFAEGEDMESFRTALESAIHEVARSTGKLGPLDGDGWCPVWPEAIYEGSVVAYNHRAERRWQMTWTRTENGGFNFGEPEEVSRRIIYEPGFNGDSKTTLKGKDQAQKSFDIKISEHFIAKVKKGKTETEERFVIGGVLEPNDGVDGPLNPDSDGDIYSAEDIRKTAHGWAMKGFVPGIHHLSVAKGKISTVESYIAPQDLTIGKTTFRKGTWIMAAKIIDDDLWAKVKKGELAAWSIEGLGLRTPVEA